MPFLTFLAEVRPAIEAALDDLLPPADQAPTRLHQAMRYSVMGGGKRIRPTICLLVGQSLGVARERVLPAAAALEMIHAFSLVHDDLPALDDDDLRRGRPTCHRQYDEATAVLAGDALLAHGLTLLATEPAAVDAALRRKAVAMVGAAVGTAGMIGGQMHDLEAEHRWPSAPDAALERIHRMKTGALLTASVRLGGLYAQADDGLDERLGMLGEGLGMMFQIADDILDAEGSTGTLGKTAGKDAAADKLTFVQLYGLEEAKRRLAEERVRAEALCDQLPGDAEISKALVAFVCERDR